MTQERNDDYSNLKALTVLLVVLAHVTVFYSGLGGAIPYPTDRGLDLITRFIYQFHMQLFMFLSGAVYCVCIRMGKYKKFLPFAATKAKRLLVPYLAFGVLNVAPVMVLLGITGQSFFEYVVHGILLGGNSRHLWFLLSLFTMFLITRMGKPLMERCAGIFWVIFGGGGVLLMLYSNRFPALLSLYNTARMYGFFLAGYLYDLYQEKLHSLNRNCWPLALASLTGLILFASRGTGRITGPLAAFCGIWFSLFLIQHIGQWLGRFKWFADLKKNSMGIYLFHPMFNYVIFCLLKDAGLNPWFQSVLAFCLILLLSWLSTLGMRKCRLAMLMGE